MTQVITAVLLIIALAYLAIGFLFALWFAFKKVNEFDENAKAAPLMFRLLIIPASVALWIYLLKRIREKKKA